MDDILRYTACTISSHYWRCFDKLTEEERKEVYWATAELVKNRLDKARSVKKK